MIQASQLMLHGCIASTDIELFLIEYEWAGHDLSELYNAVEDLHSCGELEVSRAGERDVILTAPNCEHKLRITPADRDIFLEKIGEALLRSSISL